MDEADDEPVVEEKAAPSASVELPFIMPRREVNFVLNETLGAGRHFQSLGYEDLTPDFVDAVNGECCRLAEEQVAPLYASGDREGCTFSNGDVITPSGYKDAYKEFSNAGWAGLTIPEEFGGQGMPLSLGVLKSEVFGTANWSWSMYPGLSMGCSNTLMLHGSQEQKSTYLPKLSTGEWSGTMCLTEPHCGTDLGQVNTRATDNGDGR